MLINKEIIKFDERDMYVRFALDGSNGLTGYQQQIDNLTTITGIDIVNPAIDVEVRRFRYSKEASIATLMFYNDRGENSFRNITSTVDDMMITTRTTQALSSFFILDFYDTYDITNQSKIFTLYMTKILDGTPPITPKYTIDASNKNQFYYWYIPLSFINAHAGGTVNMYVKFSFFHAYNGKLRLYYNYANRLLKTPEKMFVKVSLNLDDYSWKFVSSSYTIRLDQIAGDYEANKYVDKVNDDIDKFALDKQVFPKETIFDYETGTYKSE
ncbi:MAG: hypothetical protein WC333_01140 [Dehalococcoidia bacterium]|jgi:hypothetical protein